MNGETLPQDPPYPAAHHGVSLTTYVSILAGLGEGLALDALLASERVDPDAWDRAEDAWSDALLDDEGGDLQDAFDRHQATAQDRYARPIPPLDEDLGAWLDFTRRWGADPEPHATLAALGLRPADLARLHRAWMRRLGEDPELAKRAARVLGDAPGPMPEVRPTRRAPIAMPAPPAQPAKDDATGEDDEEEKAAEVPIFAAMPGTTSERRGDAPTPPAGPPSEEARPVVSPIAIATLDLDPGLLPPVARHPPADLRGTVSLPSGLFSRVALPFVEGAQAAPTLPTARAAPPAAPVGAMTGTLDLAVVTAGLPFASDASKREPPGGLGPRPMPAPAQAAPPSAAPAPPSFGAPRPRAPAALSGTSMSLVIPKTSALPFARTAAPTPAPAPPPVRASFAGVTGELPPDLVARLAGSGLPFPASKGRPGEAPPKPPQDAGAPPPPAAPPAPAAPSLTLQQYAALCAELAVFPARTEEIFQRYGLGERRLRAMVDGTWQARLRQSPAEKEAWVRQYQFWLARFREQAPKP